MGRYALGRAVQAAVTLLVALTLIWFAVTVLPGDPVRALFGFRQPTPEAYARVQEQLRLDEPVLVQYFLYLRDALVLDLGDTFPRDPFGRPDPGVPVTALLRGVLPTSGIILGSALVIQFVAGVVAGALSAAKAGTRLGRTVDLVALLLVSTPVLVAAYVSRVLFGVELGWFPVSGVGQGWTSYVLPSLALAALSTGYITLLLKGELALALRAPYTQAARARGISDWRITTVHAMRPSLIPVATFVAANLGQLVTGLLIVEGVFRVPGVGGLLFSALGSQDRSLVVGIVTFVAMLVILANALADVVVATLDPRIRLSS
ncbi:MAG: binding-protein-dependent transport system inner rane component [Frankiales bacterium]|nr:binding-protein-dependent transport system inner rane component [Frankiales bacterium]